MLVPFRDDPETGMGRDRIKNGTICACNSNSAFSNIQQAMVTRILVERNNM